MKLQLQIVPDRELSIVASFNRYHVRYLIVGGYAMLFHGNEDRTVDDLDIWIDNRKENAQRCFSALQTIMPDSLCFTPEKLSVKGRKVDLRRNYYDVEIFTSMEGSDFDESYLRRGTFMQDGELLNFIGALDLLCIKKKAYNSCCERMEKEGRDLAFLEKFVDTEHWDH